MTKLNYPEPLPQPQLHYPPPAHPIVHEMHLTRISPQVVEAFVSGFKENSNKKLVELDVFLQELETTLKYPHERLLMDVIRSKVKLLQE